MSSLYTECQTYLGELSTDPNALIIISGESNAGGQVPNSNLTPYELSSRVSTKILNNTSLLFEYLHIGVNNLIGHQNLPNNLTSGFENGIANSADSGIYGISPVYIMKAGTGSGRISWFNDSTIIYIGANAWLQLKSRADTAIKLLTNSNKGITPKVYLFWTQGINDAINGLSATAWEDSTIHFFTKFRSRYGNVPIFMTYLPTSFTAYNTAITDISNVVNDCYALETSDATMQDAYHWNYSGMKIIASRFIYMLKAHYNYH
jgi:hypothetical protein